MRKPALTYLANGTPWSRLVRLARLEQRELAVVLVLAGSLGLLSLAVPITAQAVIRTVAIGSMRQQLLVLGGALTIGLMFAMALEIAQTIAVEAVSRRLFLRVADDFAERMVGLARNQISAVVAADRVHRFFDVVTVEKSVAAWLFDGLAAILRILAGLALLAAYHPWLMALDIFVVVAISLILWGVGHGALDSAIEESKKKYALAAWLETLAEDDGSHWAGRGGMLAATRNQELAGAWLNARSRHFRALMWQVSSIMALQIVVSVTVLVIGGFLVLNGDLDLGQLVAAELVTATTVSALGKLGKLLGKSYDLLAAMDKIGSVVDLPVAAAGEPLPADVALQVRISAEAPWPAFSLKPGVPVAILDDQRGHGAQLMAMLAGFLDPPRGAVFLAGTDILELDQGARADRVRRIRPAPMASGTVRDLLCAHLRADCSVATLRQALVHVGLASRVDRLPQGMETRIERDGHLSIVERVLLDTAAVQLTQPGLVLLDGALDGLDDGARATVLRVLGGAQRPWTLLVRTTRPDVARHFATVIALTPGATTDVEAS